MNRNDILQEAMRHRRVLTCYAYSMLKDWSLAEDAVQEATIAASDKWESFRGDSAILTWLRSITRRKAVDILRKRRREVDYQPDALEQLVEKAFDKRLTADESERLEGRRRALTECMQKLRQDTFEILVSFYRDRIPCDELALRYGRSTNAVWLVLSRSRKQLRTCIQKRLATVS
jgi:RNA polymerase sigma-70 factor (ECF subfamily)